MEQLPTWVKTKVYNNVVELEKQVHSCKQKGVIVISRNRTYFKKDEEIVNVDFQQIRQTRPRHSTEKSEKYVKDLQRFEVYPPAEIIDPFEYNDNDEIKAQKLYFQLQQRRVG